MVHQLSVAVTGSSRGIGKAVAKELLGRGARVVINGRDASALEQTRQELAAVGNVQAVVGSPAQQSVAMELLQVAQVDDKPLALINCAGISEPAGSSILAIEPTDWYQLIEAHLHTTFMTCRVFAPAMVAAGGGAIVNTTSHAFTGIFGGTGYAAGKGGVNSLTYAVAAELREHQVWVNAIAPGAQTRLSTGSEYRTHIQQLHDRGILDELMFAGALEPPPAHYVARLYAFLVSSHAAGISGRVFAGAGGYVGEFNPVQETLLAYRDHSNHPAWDLPELAELIPTKEPGADQG